MVELAEYKLRNSPLSKVVITDTIPRHPEYWEEHADWLDKVSTAPLIKGIIDAVHYKKSLKPLIKQEI